MKKTKNNKSVNKFFIQVLKLKVAIALLILLSLIVNAGDVVVENGKLDAVSDITGNRICIGADCRTSWPSGGSGLPSGTSGQTLRNDGTNWIANGILTNDGSNVAIQNNNEVYLNIQNTEASGRQYALISAGSLGGIGVGKFSIYDKTADANRLAIDATGNVGIGTINPSEKLTVNGNVVAAAYFFSSDASLKKNINKLEGMKIISELKGISFNWKDTGKADVGLIAQDVEKVLPELVATDSSTGLKSVKYGNLVAPLIEAVKELKEQNYNQSMRIAELEKELNLLRKEIQSNKSK